MNKFTHKIYALLTFTVIVFFSCSDDDPTGPVKCIFDSDINPNSSVYEVLPDICNCEEGVLSREDKDKVLNRVNYYRALHGLPNVAYNPDNDKYVQQSALIILANQNITHYPAPGSECYTAIGDTGSWSSNLHLANYSSEINYNSEHSIDGWINEEFSIGGSIGHRRWLLNPFLKTIAFGRVEGVQTTGNFGIATVIHIFDTDGATNSNVEYIAFPFHDYPISGFKPGLILSFSVLADKSKVWGNNQNVDFSVANISVIDENNNPITITDIAYANNGQGLPNSLEWKCQNLQIGVRYNVSITNVDDNGATKNYEYWFRTVQ